MNDLYQEIILEEFQHPKNVGILDGEKYNVKVVKKTNVGCGDEFSVAVQVSTDGSTIEDIKWQGHGCAISTSAMSLLSEYVKGKSAEEVMSLSTTEMLVMIGLEEITPAREKCLLLSLKAVKGALGSGQ